MPIITKRELRPCRTRRSARDALRTLFAFAWKTSTIATAIVVALGVVACGSAAGVDPNWEVELPFSHVDLAAVVDDAVFCLGSDAELSSGIVPCRMVIHSSSTGAERFHTILDLRALGGSPPGRTAGSFVLIEGSIAIVMSDVGRMRAFEATSGREIWSREDVDEVLGSGDGYIFASDKGSRLAAFDAKTGARAAVDTFLSWKQRISQSANVIAAGGRLFVATGESLCAVDVPTWRERWVLPFESRTTSLQVSNGCVVATTRNGWQVFDASAGTLLWRFEAYESRRPLPPTVIGDLLFTMRGRASNSEAEDGYLRVYDLRTGELRKRLAMSPLPEPDGLVEAGGRLYLASTEPHYGLLRRPLVESTSGEELANTLDCRPSAIDPASGQVLWTGEPATWGSLSRPAVSNDGFVAVVGMTPKRNKPAKLMGYRPVFAK